ncbi:MAG: MATE family efflux transporter [Candidatus Obscuribacterales bacterium]|nr:MATE family efflux transporter [Candidatus Obscuribacterales bacterium]
MSGPVNTEASEPEGSVDAETIDLSQATSGVDGMIVNSSLWRAIWHLSWPLYLNMMTIALASFSEIWVGGRLGSAAQAAIGLGGQIWFFLVLLVVALSAGTNALVSRFWGAGDIENAVTAARQSIIFSLIFGLGIMGAGMILCRPLLRMLGASAEVEELGWQMLKYDLIGQPLICIHWVSNAIFRARGNTVTPMITAGVVCFLVILLNFGLCVWPLQIGISGLGMSWPLASIVGVVLTLYLQRKSDIGYFLDWKGPGISAEWFIRIMKIGVPACVQDLAWVGGNFLLLFILAKCNEPTAAEAAWGIGLRLEESLCSMPVCALATAVATIVGQNLGAEKPERADRAGWLVGSVGAGYSIVLGLAMCLFAEPVARFMSSDASVVAYTVDYLRIVGLAQPFVAVWLILAGAMQGAGYTRAPMMVTIVFLVFLRLPLAWGLSIGLGLGPTGTWLSLSISSALVAAALCWQYKSGVWKNQKV